MRTLYLSLRSLRNFLSVRSDGLCVLCSFGFFFTAKNVKEAQRAQRFVRNSYKVYTSG